MTAVSVAVPVFNRRERMLRCMEALLAQDHPDYEVLVLDNGSTDGTLEACQAIAETAPVPVRVLELAGSVGAIRNEAARITDRELIAFTDSDCIPEAGWLSALTAPLQTDPAVGVVCGITRAEEAFTDGWPATMEVPEWTGRFESCNIAFRTEALRDSAGFDEEVGHFWEDTAAGYALLRAGWGTAFAPAAVVAHDVTYPGFQPGPSRGPVNSEPSTTMRLTSKSTFSNPKTRRKSPHR